MAGNLLQQLDFSAPLANFKKENNFLLKPISWEILQFKTTPETSITGIRGFKKEANQLPLHVLINLQESSLVSCCSR